jgi:hypothetical protein
MKEIINNEMFCNEILHVCSVNKLTQIVYTVKGQLGPIPTRHGSTRHRSTRPSIKNLYC